MYLYSNTVTGMERKEASKITAEEAIIESKKATGSVYEVGEKAYHDAEDKQLLYIACTRALHRLSLCYTGELSHFLKTEE